MIRAAAVVVASLLAGCGGTTGSPPDGNPPPSDGSFELIEDVSLAGGIDSASFGSAAYAAGATVHLDVTFESYEAAVDNRELVLTINNGSDSQVMDLIPFCETMYGLPYRETDAISIDWSQEEPSIGGMGTCETPTMTFGWAD